MKYQKFFLTLMLLSIVLLMLGCRFLTDVFGSLFARDTATNPPTDTPAILQPSLPTNTQVPTTAPTAESITRFREKDGMEMVYIPAGSFLMGSTDEQLAWVKAQPWSADFEERWYEGVQPAHNVSLDAYWIDKYEVSNAQYQKCVEAGQCNPPAADSSQTRFPYYGTPEYASYPVMWVLWYDARAYCTWAGGSLPTEAQWEYAAIGDTGWIFPWGDMEPTCSLTNFNGCADDTQPVDSFPAGVSPFGVFNMAGNVEEWVLDWYSSTYYGESPNLNPTGPSDGETRVLRGGGIYETWLLRAAFRNLSDPHIPGPDRGFRCVAINDY